MSVAAPNDRLRDLAFEPALDVERLVDAITRVRRRYASGPGYDEMYDSALAAVTELLIGPGREAIVREYAALASERAAAP